MRAKNGTALSADDARRLALTAQGLDRPRPRGPVTAGHLRQVIARLGLLQIDYVNVLTPAQYQVPFSRLGPYDRRRLDDLVYRGGEFTEHWAHEASIVPMTTWPLLRYRRQAHRVRSTSFERALAEDRGYPRRVLGHLLRRGALTAAELPPMRDGRERLPGAWLGTVQRAMLESQFGQGRVGVADRRPDFRRVYDLIERVVPDEHRTHRVSTAEAHRTLLAQAARAHGVATAADLADYHRMPVGLTRPRLRELVDAGTLCEARVEGWRETAYMAKGARAARRPAAATLLCPFDPLVWYRPRAARLFEFDYRLEIFIPASKRRWGYYVLPFLLGDRLRARVDLKSDRPARRLMVRAAYLEPHEDGGMVAEALANELRTWAGWLGLDTIAATGRDRFTTALRAALRRT